MTWFSLVRGAALAIGLLVASALAAAEPGKLWIYIGTYTGEGSQGIYRCDFDPASGTLTAPHLAAEAVHPSFLAVDPRHRFLYAVNEIDRLDGKPTGAVSAFAINGRTGVLTALNQQPSHGTAPCHLTVDKAGKHVLVANYGSGSVAVLPIESDGRLGPATCVVQHQGKSVDRERQGSPHAHCVKLDASNRHAFVCDLGLDKVMIYRYDAVRGKLTPNDPPFARVKPGSGPRHIAFGPDERNAYVINEMASTITAFTYDPSQGALKSIQNVSTLPSGYSQPTSCAEIEVHPTGKWVYGSNRGFNSIVAFEIAEKSGKLKLIGQQRRGINVPRNFAITPDGSYILVANQDGRSVIVFRIDSTTGQLHPVGKKIAVSRPVCIVPMQPPQ